MVTLTYQERFKTDKGVFDAFTQRTLFILQSKGAFDALIGPLSIGKESNVFLASKGKQMVIVKIYRMQNCDFTSMYDYIRKDPRYLFLQNKRRQIILAWVQREYKNLLRAEKAGIRVPQVFDWKNHILIEEMIGSKEPAPKLKDAPPKAPQQFFDKVIGMMEQLYTEGLIHGDLSSFNILNDKEMPVFIDFSQATLVKTPNSLELLERDVKNVLAFFKKVSIREDPEQILKRITKTE